MPYRLVDFRIGLLLIDLALCTVWFCWFESIRIFTSARSYITCTKLSPIIDIYGRCNVWANVNELAGEYPPQTRRILWMRSEDTNHVAARAVDLFIDIVALSLVRENIVFINMFRRLIYDGPAIAPLLTSLLSTWWWLHGLFSIKKFDKSFRADIILIPM
jgi:hypothetical protein